MKDIRKIKGLTSQIKILEGDAEVLKIQASNIQRERSAKLLKVKELKNQIQRLNENGKIKVSEHAIVRYFERVKGFDIEAVENEILTEEVLSLVDQLGGNGGYPNKDFKVLMKNFTVTTVIK